MLYIATVHSAVGELVTSQVARDAGRLNKEFGDYIRLLTDVDRQKASGTLMHAIGRAACTQDTVHDILICVILLRNFTEVCKQSHTEAHQMAFTVSVIIVFRCLGTYQVHLMAYRSSTPAA